MNNFQLVMGYRGQQGLGDLDWSGAHALGLDPYVSSSGGGFQWSSLIQPIANFGNTFLAAWRDRGVADAGFAPGFSPYATQTGYGQQPQLTAAQAAALAQAQADAAAGSKVSSGLSQAWQQLAGTIGVQPGTLTIIVAGAVALAFMKPPGRGRG